MSYVEIMKCRICGDQRLDTILSLGELFLTGIFPKIDSCINVTHGPLTLVKCFNCGLVQLKHSYELTDLYGANYGYRSGLNKLMVEHLRQKAQKLQEIVKLTPGDCVVDIGSNDGTLLSFYPDSVRIFGFDPSAQKFLNFYRKDIQVITDFFSASAFKRMQRRPKAKIITSIAMFYDLEQPVDFAKQVASILDENGVWHFEQSYLPSMIEANAYDTICHEHLEYYAFKQIKWIIDSAGLKTIDIEMNNVNGGSFSITAAKKAAVYPEQTDKISLILEKETSMGHDEFKSFENNIFVHKAEFVRLLRHLKQDGKKVFGYGASTKGNVILQFCGIDKTLLPCIAEVNPDKFGCVTPGTNIPIICEEEARKNKPDYFVVLPWHFRKNIIEREQEFLRKGGQLIFPLPQIEIVKK